MVYIRVVNTTSLIIIKYFSMKQKNIFSSLIISFVLSGCGNATPGIVSSLNQMQIPAVQPDSDASFDKIRAHAIYTSNFSRMEKLTTQLKHDFLNDTRSRDIFDTHSVAHQVYRALTNIEQAQLVNEQYYQEGNLPGLQKIQTMLNEYKTDIE